MECRAFDYTAVDDLGALPSKSVQKCGAILSVVFDFYDFVRRAVEIEAVVVKCTLILYFLLSLCIKLPKVWFLSAAAPDLVLVFPAFSVDP